MFFTWVIGLQKSNIINRTEWYGNYFSSNFTKIEKLNLKHIASIAKNYRNVNIIITHINNPITTVPSLSWPF